MKRIAFAAALLALTAACTHGTNATKRAASARKQTAPASATRRASSFTLWPGPPADTSSCVPPMDVATNLPHETSEQLPAFDDYSWKAFAALICDAKEGQRGVPDAKHGRDGQGKRVFETFKSAWEVFHSGKVSTDPNTYEDARYNPWAPMPRTGPLS